MRSSMFLSSLASVLGAIALVAACTTTTTTVVDGSDASTGDAGKRDGATTSSSSSGGDDAGEEPAGDDKCGAEADFDGCATCCAQNYQKGTSVLLQAAIACGCTGTGSKTDAGQGSGPCSADCAATICAATPKNPDAKCNTCLNSILDQGGACYDSVAEICTKNADCAAQQGCLQQQCASKQ